MGVGCDACSVLKRWERRALCGTLTAIRGSSSSSSVVPAKAACKRWVRVGVRVGVRDRVRVRVGVGVGVRVGVGARARAGVGVRARG